MEINRKQIKKEARGNVSRHYWLYIFICTIAAYLGTEEVRTFRFLDLFTINTGPLTAALPHFDTLPAFNDLIGKVPELGTTNGVFALIYRTISSGIIPSYIVSSVNSFTHDPKAGTIVLMILVMLAHFMIWFFVIQCLTVVNRRFCIEGRIYEKVPIDRYLFFIRDRKWFSVAWALFYKNVLWFLWALTIVGGFIKHYAYLLVPYILAEDPEIKAQEAVELSKKMMNGHKWEAFKISLSLMGWYVLDLATLGISNIFWTNAYRLSIFSEYYERVRASYLEACPQSVAVLNNPYLFEIAPKELLDHVYRKEIEEMNSIDPIKNVYTGFKGFLERNFGLVFQLSPKEKAYEKYMFSQWDLKEMKEQVEGRAYPLKLSPFVDKPKRHLLRHLYPERNYSITSVVLLFFFMSFVGWCWEVSLHLIHNGQFVDRGVLHLPWLPIYGSGCVVILLLLRRWRQEPLAEFILAVVLCGCVEYFTSVYLQAVYHTQWWNYDGYFLNLNGRICAEGLLVFGLGGMAFVYIIAPLLDNWFRKIGLKRLQPLAILLIAVFIGDVIYSHFYPNEGEGITTGSVVNEHVKKKE